MESGRGRQSVIFEPLQNVQMSRSKFQVTSFVDFQPYLDYFNNYEKYLNRFTETVAGIPHSTVYKAVIKDIGGTFHGNDTHEASCDTVPQCNQPYAVRQFSFDRQNSQFMLHYYPVPMCRSSGLYGPTTARTTTEYYRAATRELPAGKISVSCHN